MPSDLEITFLALGEDVIIYILSFLKPQDVVCMSAACKRLQDICNLKIVWSNACQYHIVAKGYPFTSITSLSSISVFDLRSKVLHADALSKRWISGITSPRSTYYISGTSGTCVSDVRFLPGYGDRLLLTISKTVWSAASIWDIYYEEAKMVGQWSPRGAIFTGYAINSEVGSKAAVAISVQLHGSFTVKVLYIEEGPDHTYAFVEIYNVATDMKPVTLCGDILALADLATQTAIWNWRDGTYAILRNSTEDTSYIRYNDCLQVLFAHESVLVVRTHSIHIFPYPSLIPYDRNSESKGVEFEAIACHSFGWVDGICAGICPELATSKSTETHWPPISILVRGESDDPWAQDTHYLELYSLFPSLDYSNVVADPPSSPYIFPPRKSYRIRSRRGFLRCKQIMLGKFGTAVWLELQERFSTGLVTGLVCSIGDVGEWQDMDGLVQRHESLRLGVFPGSLCTQEGEIGSKSVLTNGANNWTCFDYDEVGGRVALGSSFGKIVMISL